VTTRQFWDQRFAEEGYRFGTEPIEFLAEQAPRLTPGGRALALADGEGRNGVWLAEQGMHVLSLDISENALAKGRALAAERGVDLDTQCIDANDWAWPTTAFDLVVSIYFHPAPDDRRRLHAAIIAALKPGGLFILEAFSKNQIDYGTGGPSDPDRLYSAADLTEDFATTEIDVLTEKVVRRRGGRFPGQPAAITRLIARKP
jgi:SAM-dependent methyltransferase